MDNFIEEKRVVNVQANKEIDTVENSLDQKLDGLQSVYQEEENTEGECLSDTMVEEQCLQLLQEGLVENFESSDIGVVVCLWEKKEAIPLLLTEEEVEEHKEKNLPLPPTNSIYILPSSASSSQPKTPVAEAKVIPSTLPALQNLKKLVAIVQTFVTTLKKMAATHTAWHSGWFGCGFGFGAPEPQHF